MTKEEFRKITSEFKDVSEVISTRRRLKTKENRLRRKLKYLLTKYSFLKDLVDIDSSGTPLVNAVKMLFKELGLKKVENVDKKYKDEDLRLWTDNKLLIFEITGIDTPTPKDDKAHRISKHIPIRQKQNLDKKVFGVFVVNHDNKRPFGKRHKKPFRQQLIDIAESHSYTLTTTTDLFNAFILFKKGGLTADELIDKLCKKGELKISGTS